MKGVDRICQNDPGASYVVHKAELDSAWSRVMESRRYILGSEVERFECEMADYLNVPFAVGTASGTDALELALRSVGVGAGDRVCTVSHTAVATAAAIVAAGARPLWVDIDPATFNLDANRLEDALRRDRRSSSSGTLKAVIVVHLYGQAADMAAVNAVAIRHELAVVEDCAQAHGAAIHGRKVGSWGDVAAFSFYPTKNLGAFGDGGLVVTRERRIADQVRRLREYGWDVGRVSRECGINSRLDELQAAILRVKLRHLDAENGRRRELANLYDSLLPCERVATPTRLDQVEHVFHQYVIRCSPRDRLREFLAAKAIGSVVHYPAAVHQQPAYQQFSQGRDYLEHTERAVREVLSLPMYPQLPAESVHRVAAAIREFQD